jgi:hypothetical protein
MCYFGSTWPPDIVILDTPQGDLIKVSSTSDDLLLFSSKTGSHPNEGAGVAPKGSSSVSIGELWPGIDRLDEVGPESTSVVPMQDPWRDQASHSRTDPRE